MQYWQNTFFTIKSAHTKYRIYYKPLNYNHSLNTFNSFHTTILFDTPWKHQKTSGGYEMGYEMG